MAGQATQDGNEETCKNRKRKQGGNHFKRVKEGLSSGNIVVEREGTERSGKFPKRETMKTKNMGGFKEELAGAIAVRE